MQVGHLRRNHLPRTPMPTISRWSSDAPCWAYLAYLIYQTGWIVILADSSLPYLLSITFMLL